MRIHKALIGFGLLADAGLVALLIAVSGFIFEGPEGARGEISAVLGWSTALLVCILSPALGLYAWRKGRQGLASALTWLPPAAALLGLLISA